MESRKTSTHKGFTLIEILVVLAIFLTLAGLCASFSLNFFRAYLFAEEENTAISLLQKARSQAINNIGQQPHGLHIDDGQYVLFSGTVYNPDNPSNIKFPANGNISHNGMTEVIFSQLDGSAAVSGGTLNFSYGSGLSAIININSEGRINY